MQKKHILWFEEVGKEDVGVVGGKGANLGEMVNAGIPVPGGFIVTAATYFDFLQETNLKAKLHELLKDVDVNNSSQLDRVSKAVKQLINKTKMPEHIALEIMKYYQEMNVKLLAGKRKKPSVLQKIKGQLVQPLVAVRSSATAEDLPTASFAGQQATFLNVQGEANVVEMVKQCWASLFEARAIFYRQTQGFDHFKVGIAVPVQKMIESDASGVMFSIDPVNNDKSIIVIEAIYGLGEYIVQGTVTPDHYEVDKKTLHILKKSIATQEHKMALKGKNNVDMILKKDARNTQKISDRHIIELANLARKLEKHYYFPQDIEWALENNEVFIVQTRPITTIKKQSAPQTLADSSNRKVILTGDPASPGIASGAVRLLHSAKDIDKIHQGEVLVAPQTNPDYVPAMKKACAIVTEHGGRTSHAAIVSRELGIPAVVGTPNAMSALKNGQVITVEGATGKIYDGGLSEADKASIARAAKPVKDYKTATKVYVNLAEPSRVEEVAKRHVDGIGLLRAEFMVAEIGQHPRKMLKDKKRAQYIDMLAEKMAVFCKAFNPRPVVYRATDFKTNEYRNLTGGKEFEPEEANPMLGFRGAARYIADPEVFLMELEAIKRVRNKMNLKNLWLMIPFVRTPKELSDVKKIIASEGLTRSSSFKLWMMVELPINVIILDDFINIGVDGVSIGSNDLTMLIMGTDRDNDEVAHVFDERNPAVSWALERIITTCHKHHITCSICGQAPSDYPELVENLVRWGVTSVSVNPDAIERVRETIYHAERKLLTK